MKILIVEDELLAAEDLERKLEKLGHEVTGIAESYDAALESLAEKKPDLVLVDIELKGDLTGIDLSEELNKRGIHFIYLSGLEKEEVYLEAENTGRLTHLSKPIDIINLRNTLWQAKAAIDNSKREKPRFLLITAGRHELIDPYQIIYLQAARGYCDVFLVNGRKKTQTKNMREVFEKLNHPDFFKIHKSYVVNKKHILKTTANTIEVTGKTVLPIGPLFKKGIKSKINKI